MPERVFRQRSGEAEDPARTMHPLVLGSITHTLTHWVGKHGAYAVFALMAVDALLPVGGELTMLVAGAVAGGAVAGATPVLLGHTLATGIESYVILALAGTFGYLVGALAGWALGRWRGRDLVERHGRWLHLDAARLHRAEAWFARHGRAAVFLGRLTPVVRSFISIPAGVLESPLVSYGLLTLAGSAVWCFGFAGAGWALGNQYDQVHHAFTGIEVAAVAAAAVAAGVLLTRRRRGRTDEA
jgi:membrane protein DedA with SNARE-associated domain